MSTVSTVEPRIYVACLAAYNNGCLHGKWIDAAQDAEDIHEEIQEMLKASPVPGAEEWAIHDFEGFEGWTPHEYESIEDIALFAKGLEEYGPAFGVYVGFGSCGDMQSYLDSFEDHYQGEWDSREDFAADLVEELGYLEQIPENLRYYFDYEAFARDLFIDGYSDGEDSSGQLHVFADY